MRTLHSAALLALFLVLAVPAPAEPLGPDLNDLALSWSRGEYRAPLVCEIEGEPYRGLRRIRITPGPRGTLRTTNRIQLYDLEVPRGTRCFTETGRVEPNALGALYLHREGSSKPDTAARDFENLLRREDGVEFTILRGRLRLGDAGSAPSDLEEVDFAGGTARIERLRRGSDAYRRLADMPGVRKLTLTLTAPDRSPLTFDLVQQGRP